MSKEQGIGKTTYGGEGDWDWDDGGENGWGAKGAQVSTISSGDEDNVMAGKCGGN